MSTQRSRKGQGARQATAPLLVEQQAGQPGGGEQGMAIVSGLYWWLYPLLTRTPEVAGALVSISRAEPS